MGPLDESGIQQHISLEKMNYPTQKIITHRIAKHLKAHFTRKITKTQLEVEDLNGIFFPCLWHNSVRINW